MILKVIALNVNYDGISLLRDINFSLKKGEILCLLGPSGSGKTTLLHALAGLKTPDSGTFFFAGENITSLAPYKRNFGMMFQDYALFPHKNVADNVGFGLKIQGISRNEQQRRIAEVLEVVGLSGYGARKVSELSGGEQQRVALARSLAPRPRLLFLDEPLGSLDRSLRDRLATEIRAILKKLKVTAIFVTHDQTEAFSVADRVAILQQGKLVQIGKPEEVYRYPVTREIARFLGFRNFITGEVDEDIFRCALGKLSLPGPVISGETLLLRPEGARLVTSEDPYLICGKVVESVYLGATHRVTVGCMGEILNFELPLEPRPPFVGEMIYLWLEQDSLVVLAQ